MRVSVSEAVFAYAISAVRYSADRARIERVRIHAVTPGSVGPPLEISRESFLMGVELGRGFVVLARDRNGRYVQDGVVALVQVGGVPFLRCDADPWPADHLAAVAEF
jgi:hypothetical protein